MQCPSAQQPSTLSTVSSFRKAEAETGPSNLSDIVYVCISCHEEFDSSKSKCAFCECRVLLKKPPKRYAQVFSTD